MLRTFSIRLLKSLFSVSICRSLVTFIPTCSTTDPTLSTPFRIAGICAEISRTQAPGKQWVCTLPSANVARTCWTMESQTITASPLTERNEVVAGGDLEEQRRRKGGGRRLRPVLLLPLLHPESVVSRRRGEGHLGRSHSGCTGPVQRNARCRGGGSVCGVLQTYLWASAQDVSSVALCSLSWACFPSSSWICLSTASSSSCTEWSLNVSSSALKGRHKSAIKTINS